MSKKVTDWVLILVSASIVLAVLYGGYCDVLDGRYVNPILEFGARSQIYTHHTTQEVYHSGDMVYAKVLVQKNRNIPGTLRWSLVNSHLVQYSPRDGGLPIGIWEKMVRIEQIPYDARPGPYWFCGTVTYKPNWLGQVQYSIWTNKFEVVQP